jgi:hypothetical protein
MSAIVAFETAEVVTANVCDLVEPAGTTTVAGTFATGELLDKFTTVPPAGEGDEIIT